MHVLAIREAKHLTFYRNLNSFPKDVRSKKCQKVKSEFEKLFYSFPLQVNLISEFPFPLNFNDFMRDSIF